MGVLTSKQYQKLQDKKLEVKKDETAPQDVTPECAVTPTVTREYVLFFPEMIQSAPRNFENKICIDGKEYKYQCVNDIIKVSGDILGKHLIAQGYGILEIKENSNG